MGRPALVPLSDTVCAREECSKRCPVLAVRGESPAYCSRSCRQGTVKTCVECGCDLPSGHVSYCGPCAPGRKSGGFRAKLRREIAAGRLALAEDDDAEPDEDDLSALMEAS